MLTYNFGTMTSQFDEHNRLLEALINQEIILGNKQAAKKLAKVVVRKVYDSGETIITQGEATSELYLILSGEVLVKINGRTRAIRKNGQQIGEMAIVNVGEMRAASVIAKTKVELAIVKEQDFAKIADKYPDLWKRMGKSIAQRLYQRNILERQKNELPQIFLASSSEGKSYLDMLCKLIEASETKVGLLRWDKNNIFKPSSYTMIDLVEHGNRVDFAIIVLSPDDITISRAKNSKTPRDNVILEAGLFIGALGIGRTFLVMPDSTVLKQNKEKSELKLPSDLAGITTLRFGRKQMVEIVEQIIATILELGTI